VSQRFVLDASIYLAVCFADTDAAAPAATILQRLETGHALVPGLWSSEIRNALVVQERRGRIQPDRSDRFLAQLTHLPIDVDLDGLSRTSDEVLALARRHQLTVYDSLYLELALRIRLPLATLDAALASAAARESVALLLAHP
jgi:predicted nucleic acid-binding protein